MKRTLFLLLTIMLAVVLSACGDGGEPETGEKKAPEEAATKDDKKDKDVKAEDEDATAVLSGDDLDKLKSHLEDVLKAEQDFGDMFYLEKFDYDAKTNNVSAQIDMQQDPIPETKEDVADWAETWAWSLAESAPEVSDKYNVRVTLVTKVDDGHILWGHSRYNADNGKYKFKEESGMKLYD